MSSTLEVGVAILSNLCTCLAISYVSVYGSIVGENTERGGVGYGDEM